LLDYAFQILNLYNVTLWASAGEREKLDCYKSSGFKEIGRRRELIMAGTDKFDLVYMDILADEFFESDVPSNIQLTF
jgi:RimJ/RimL family protein N-acetyltransferase